MVQRSVSQTPLPSLLSRLSAGGDDTIAAAVKPESNREKRKKRQWELLRYVGIPLQMDNGLRGKKEHFEGIPHVVELTLRLIAVKINDKKEKGIDSVFTKEEKDILQQYAQGDLLGIPAKAGRFERWLEKNEFV